ncbi:MAG: fibronectin type III domain-containing protein, partial [Patescibacteria group bacterium]
VTTTTTPTISTTTTSSATTTTYIPPATTLGVTQATTPSTQTTSQTSAATSTTISSTSTVSSTTASTSTTATSTADITLPSVPTNLVAYIASTYIDLSWPNSTDNVGVTGYKVYRGGTQIGTVVPSSTTATTASYSDTNLQSSTAYTYTVSAYDAAGNNSAQSASVAATTLAPPQVTVTLIVTYPNGGETFGYQNTSFSYNSNGVSRVGYKLLKGGSQTVYETTAPTAAGTSLPFSPFPNSTWSAYQSGNDYKIRVYDWDNPGTYDESDSYFSVDVTPPVISALSVSSITSNSAVITWTTDEPTYSAGANYGSTSNDWAITPRTYTHVTSHSATLTGLNSGTLYKYRVTSVDEKGNSTQTPLYPAYNTFTTQSGSSFRNDTEQLADLLISLSSLLQSLQQSLR